MNSELYLSYFNERVYYSKKDKEGLLNIQANYSNAIGEELIKYLEDDSFDTPYNVFPEEEVKAAREYFKNNLRNYLSEGLNFNRLDNEEDRKPLPIELIKHVSYLDENYTVKFQIYGDYKSGYSLGQLFYADNVYKAIKLEIIKLIETGIYFKTCKNCGKLFIPSIQSSEIKYCDRVFRNGRTCKEVGYERTIMRDDYKKLYRQWYKNYNAQTARKNKDKNLSIKNIKENKSRFVNWVKNANILLNSISTGEKSMSPEKFKEELNDLWENKKEE